MAAELKLVQKESNVDRQKALEAALAQIDRAFGKGSAMKLGQKETMQVEAISTGSLGLDIALGVGGLPRGQRVMAAYLGAVKLLAVPAVALGLAALLGVEGEQRFVVLAFAAVPP